MASRPMIFWLEHVLPNYEAYNTNRADTRLAMNAAVSAYQMADYVFEEYRGSDPAKVSGHSGLEAFRHGVLCFECRDFELLGDAANAHKHLWINIKQGPGSVSSGRSATETFVSGGTVCTRDAIGNQVDFGRVLDDVIAMWRRLIIRYGY